MKTDHLDMTSMNKRPGRLLFAASAAAALALLLGACNKTPEPGIAAPSTSGTASTKVADLDVSANVKKALKDNALLETRDITVVTLNGDVRLTGTLDSQAQIDEALKTARAANGAQTVKDDLTIKK